MRVKSIRKVDNMSFRLRDVTVTGDNTFLLENGLITHNSMYPQTVVGGGTGAVYSANQIFIITKAGERDDEGLTGNRFTITISKSRYVREQSKFPFTVSFKNGIYKLSAVWDWAVEAGLIQVFPSGWYKKVDLETGEILEPKKRRAEIEEDMSFMRNLLKNKQFIEHVENRYRLSSALASDDAASDEEIPDREDVGIEE